MRFAIALLVLLALACAVGSVIPQGQSFEWYASAYSERTAAIIVSLWLDDLYHSWWLIALTAFLCGNLLLCNLTRIRPILRRVRAAKAPEAAFSLEPTVQAESVSEPQAVFSALGMPKPIETEHEGKRALFSSKNSLGYWGAWVCHLGILLLLLGFTLGQMTHTEYTVYGVAGQTKQIGDTALLLTIDDFSVGLREDDTVSQYTAAITVRDADTGSSEQAEISVNHPATLYGMQFYQNSTGWAADVAVTKDGEPLQQEILCAGECILVADKPDLQICFNAFYPDYVLIPGSGPATASGALKNPAYLYSVTYAGEFVGMNVLTGEETLKIDNYEIRFSNPRNYTLIQIKQDKFTSLALAGAIITLLGLFLALYVQPKRVWAVEEEAGWTVFGFSQKGGAIFAEQFRSALPEKEDP